MFNFNYPVQKFSEFFYGYGLTYIQPPKITFINLECRHSSYHSIPSQKWSFIINLDINIHFSFNKCHAQMCFHF